MISVSVSNISYQIGTKDIVRNISFSLNSGDRMGIIGINGAGKSTLLKILAGEISDFTGSVFIPGNSSFGILHQDDTFNIDRNYGTTVLEQMYGAFPDLLKIEKEIEETEKGIQLESDSEMIKKLSSRLEKLNADFAQKGGLYYKSRCQSLLSGMGFDGSYHSLPVTSLSGGQRTRIALAKLLLNEPDLLILDEPTNHLDSYTTEWLEDYLSSYKKTLIAVSHDRFFLDKVTNKTLEIENTRSRLYNCSYTPHLAEKAKAFAEEEKKFSLQQKEIAKQKTIIENQRKWGREKNIRKAESREKALEKIELLEKPVHTGRSIHVNINEAYHTGKVVLDASGLCMSYPETDLFKDLSFRLLRGERLFITGKNGSGKSTLIKIINGEIKPLKGNIEYGFNVIPGYYSQENQDLNPLNSVIEEIWGKFPDMSQTEVRNSLASFLFTGESAEKKVAVLSGGEKARLTLLKLILSDTNLLILDEPTNHLDIPSREALENALENYGGTIIAVSHDRYFISKIATRFIDISFPDIKYFTGDYGSFRDFISLSGGSDPAQEKNESVTEENGKNDYLKRKNEAARKRKTENRLKKIKEETKLAEDAIEKLNSELFGEASTDYIRASEISEKISVLEEKLMTLYEEEEYLTADPDGSDPI